MVRVVSTFGYPILIQSPCFLGIRQGRISTPILLLSKISIPKKRHPTRLYTLLSILV